MIWEPARRRSEAGLFREPAGQDFQARLEVFLSSPVTWLLPVRNGMPFLPETLASIESQTYRNWTILVWDNGSTDGTLEELRRWIPHRLPGRIISGEPLPLGLSLARLVELSETEFCARIDADDVNDPRRLEQQVAFLEQNPSVGMVGSDAYFMDTAGRTWPCPDPFRPEDAEIRWQMRWRNPILHPSVLLRKGAVLNAGNYRDVRLQAPGSSRIAPAEDYDLWVRMSQRTEMANLPQRLIKYRRHQASWSQDDNEYFHYFRMVAEFYAGFLFTGLNAAEALDLREKAIRDTRLRVARRDLARYRKAAMETAAALGKARDYFLRTAAYQEYRRELLRNYVVQHPIGRAMIRLKRFARIRLGAS